MSPYGVITFDGPAASGKSSVAQRIAAALDLPVVSSGLLYRAATLIAEGAQIDLDDEEAVMARLRRHDVELEPVHDGNRVRLDGADVTETLHTDEVDGSVSAVARHPRVRSWVSEHLRRVAPPFVIDGRDMGTVVFPEASDKFYLTASPEVRAKRRVGERAADLERVAHAIRRRDALDAHQLVPANDAQRIDTDPLTLDEVVALVLEALRARRASSVGAPTAGPTTDHAEEC
ncbi:MAG: (d)CMP kinase [Trueperaceae bacterium]|nr:(d)CMP kinase [Trueperaceae bacterium]